MCIQDVGLPVCAVDSAAAQDLGAVPEVRLELLERQGYVGLGLACDVLPRPGRYSVGWAGRIAEAVRGLVSVFVHATWDQSVPLSHALFSPELWGREDLRYHVGRTGPNACLLYTSPSPRDRTRSRMPSSA